MSVKIHNGVEYHYAHQSVKCVADRDGCEVFEIDLGKGKRRVLALDKELARDEYMSREACRYCQSIPCQCCYEDDDDDD